MFITRNERCNLCDKNGENVGSFVGCSWEVKGFLQHIHTRVSSWEKWLKGDVVCLVSLCLFPRDLFSPFGGTFGLARFLPLGCYDPCCCPHMLALKSCKIPKGFQISPFHQLEFFYPDFQIWQLGISRDGSGIIWEDEATCCIMWCPSTWDLTVHINRAVVDARKEQSFFLEVEEHSD